MANEKKFGKNSVVNSDEKLKLAQKIAENSKKLTNTAANVENFFLYAFRSITGLLGKIFSSNVLSRIFALILAVVMYVAANANEVTTGIVQSLTINDIPVMTVYNSEIYEVTGIPDKVSVIVQGDMGNITLQRSQVNSSVSCDLSGLSEGVYSIKLVPTNFNSQLSVNILDTPTVTVTIKKKTTTKFNIASEFINVKSMDPTCSLSAPTFDTTEVIIRASQDTIDSIAFVKALIDVTNVTESFTKEAPIVAYDNTGKIVECDIIPSKVTASVEVTTPSKEVPIIVRPIGTLMDGYAIDKISMDYSAVTIYAANSVLDLIDAVYIDVDVSSITKNTMFSTALNVPSGVKSMSITKVNMEIDIGEVTTKVFEGIKVLYSNYDTTLKFKITNEKDALANVVVTGTADNLEKISEAGISVVMNLGNIKPGVQQVPVTVTGDAPYVTYALQNGKQYIEIEVTE